MNANDEWSGTRSRGTMHAHDAGWRAWHETEDIANVCEAAGQAERAKWEPVVRELDHILFDISHSYADVISGARNRAARQALANSARVLDERGGE